MADQQEEQEGEYYTCSFRKKSQKKKEHRDGVKEITPLCKILYEEENGAEEEKSRKEYVSPCDETYRFTMERVNSEQDRSYQRDMLQPGAFLVFVRKKHTDMRRHEIDGGHIQTVEDEIAQVETERVFAPDRIVYSITEIAHWQVLQFVGRSGEHPPNVEVPVDGEVYQQYFVVPDEAVQKGVSKDRQYHGGQQYQM